MEGRKEKQVNKGGAEGNQPVMVDDEGDGFKQDSVFGVGVLYLLRLGRLLSLTEDDLQALCQTTPQRCVLCNITTLFALFS